MTTLRVVIPLMILLSGCSFARLSYHDIREAGKTVEVGDGVSEKEAVILAQNFIVNKGMGDRLYSLKPFEVQKRILWQKDGKDIELIDPPSRSFQPSVKKSWVVLFRDREGSQLLGYYPVIPFYVDVNLDNGQIEEWGLKRDPR